MIKKTTTTLLTLSGLFAAFLLLLTLTGENVSSTMEALPAISLPSLAGTIPSVPAVPAVAPTLVRQQIFSPTPTASPAKSPPQASRVPESIPGLVRVTDATIPTPTPVPYNASELLATAWPTTVPVNQDAGSLGSMVDTVEQSQPISGPILIILGCVGLGFIVFGIYGILRGRK